MTATTAVVTGVASIIGIFGVMSGIIYRMSRDSDSKRKRIYGRIDEVKDANRKEFVLKELCEERHRVITSDLKEIKTDVKEILRRNGGSNNG